MRLDDLTRILEFASQNPILALILSAVFIGIVVASYYVAGYFSERGKQRARSNGARSSSEYGVSDTSSDPAPNEKGQVYFLRPGLRLTFSDGVSAQARMHVQYRIVDLIKLLATAGSKEHAWELLIPIVRSRAHRLIEPVPYEEARTGMGKFELLIQQELIQEFERFGLALEAIVLESLSIVQPSERTR